MKKKIVVIIDSEDNLGQCHKGLSLLGEKTAERNSDISVSGVYIKNSRHMTKLQWLLESLNEDGDVNVVIIGASQVAASPGDADAYLRNHLRNKQINVIGVAFEGKTKDDNLAARLSITQYPETQVEYAGLGEKGFIRACQMALNGALPTIILPNCTPEPDFNLSTAIGKAKAAAVETQ